MGSGWRPGGGGGGAEGGEDFEVALVEAAGDFADADSAAEAVVGALFPLVAADHREHAGDLAAEVGELADLLVGVGDLFVALFEPFEAVQGERVGVAEDQVGELPGGDGFALPSVADEQLDIFGVAEQGVDEQLTDFAGGFVERLDDPAFAVAHAARPWGARPAVRPAVWRL